MHNLSELNDLANSLGIYALKHCFSYSKKTVDNDFEKQMIKYKIYLINSFYYSCIMHFQEMAQHLDTCTEKGPLYGVPFAVKESHPLKVCWGLTF